MCGFLLAGTKTIGSKSIWKKRTSTAHELKWKRPLRAISQPKLCNGIKIMAQLLVVRYSFLPLRMRFTYIRLVIPLQGVPYRFFILETGSYDKNFWVSALSKLYKLHNYGIFELWKLLKLQNLTIWATWNTWNSWVKILKTRYIILGFLNCAKLLKLQNLTIWALKMETLEISGCLHCQNSKNCIIMRFFNCENVVNL